MTKEQILSKSLIAKALDEDELQSLLNVSCTDLADAADLKTAAAEYVGQAYMIKGVHYRCEEVSAGVYDWVTYDTSGQSLHYPDASGKPTLNGITINGTLTSSDLKLASDTTARTAAATLIATDKIPINDDKYATVSDIQLANVNHNYVNKNTQIMLTGISLTANVNYEIDVFALTGLYLAHKEAFIAAVYVAGVQIAATVTSNNLESFYIKHTANVTANVFVTFKDINWDNESVMSSTKVQIGASTYLYGFAELYFNGVYDVKWGDIFPALQDTSTHPHGVSNGFFNTLFYFVSGSNTTIGGIVYTANTIEIGGNVKSVMVGSVLFDSIVSYNATYDYTILTAASNPFPEVAEFATQDIDVKIKYN